MVTIMNYEKVYDDLINKYRSVSKEFGYETHHILPRCMGGRDTKANLVHLPPKAHFVAHRLLERIHPQEGKLKFALWMMINCTGHKINSREFSRLREECARITSESCVGTHVYRNRETGECGRYVVGEQPPGFEAIAKGKALYKNVMTGEVRQCIVGRQPEGFITFNTGTAPYKDPITGKTQRYLIGEEPRGYVHINKGMSTFINPTTQEVKRFPKGTKPEGFIHLTSGMATYRNSETGDKLYCRVGEQPKGYNPLAKGRYKYSDDTLEEWYRFYLKNGFNATKAAFDFSYTKHGRFRAALRLRGYTMPPANSLL